MVLRYFSLTKCLRGCVFLVISLCFACAVFLFQSLQFNGGNKINSIKKIERVRGVQFYQYTKTLVMPGGDDVPSTPPWSIPEVTIYREPWNLLDNNTSSYDQRYVTAKFSMSPGQGNLMFQYAALYGIAWRHNATVVIPEGMLLRRAFRLQNSTVVTFRLSMYFLKNWKRQFYPQCCRYYPETENLQNSSHHFALYGYFQSYKYFHTGDRELRNAIRTQFRFLPEIEIEASKQVNGALQKWTATSNNSLAKPILIGVHVRRGLDMTWNSRNQQHGHTVATKSYFLKAMTYFRNKFKNVLFLICTDDFYWTKQNLADLKNVYIASSKIREVDMCVLSMCNHTIMSQGTFSWWAAYLAGGETIYYNGWPRRGSPLDGMLKREDFFLPEWIPMD